jgi:hypothetical protein
MLTAKVSVLRPDLIGDKRFFVVFVLAEFSVRTLGYAIPKELICFIVHLLVCREDLVFLAKLCEQAERYDEMRSAMTRVAFRYSNLTVTERILLSVSFKNVVGTARAQWRNICAIQENEGKNDVPWKRDKIIQMKDKVFACFLSLNLLIYRWKKICYLFA